MLVKDLKRSRQFYCQVLGMEEIDSGGNCWLRHGNSEVHLLETLEENWFQPVNYSPKDLAEGNTSHVAFEVENIERAQRHLNEYDIKIVCGPRPRGGGGQQ